MKIRRFYFILITMICVSQLQAQLRDDLESSWNISKKFGQTVVNPSGRDIRIFMMSLAGVAAVSLADKPVRKWVNSNNGRFAGNLFRIDRYYGSKKYTPVSLIGLYTAGFLFKNERIRLAGLKTMQAYFLTGVVTVVTKEIFGRSRPYLNRGPFHFDPFAFSESERSFFSGHASTTFAISTILAGEFDSILWKTFWYGAAALVSAARVYNDRHWMSDVVAGSLVGYAAGRFVVRNFEQAGSSGKDSSLNFGLSAAGEVVVLRLTMPLN